ncbi:hypothetical protein GPJ56_008195 [Histomonas meleagridis]|uniref:uncharacterized protein n=1 Tax=Histomonas meleagridis TaxID=135588 RepID=UPI00355AA4F3|nr:hypothetical protein GPJ56_008195 [Histomonas meleagridis]KAH0797216.1 hypothetical protein GO595_009898 [Histomonas meleagridis]
MLASSIPNFLLDGSFLKEKTIHHYERFALVYVCYELNDNFHVNIDVKEFKNGIIISSSYYNGKNGSIVIDDTSNSCLIMFVDLSNGSNDDYLNYAFQFFEDYKVEIENENVISSKSGFLIDQIDVDIIYTPPPEIAYDDLCSDNANRPNLIPSPLYEVYTQVLANLKYYLMNLRKNEVLTDAKFMRFFQEEENEVMLESVEEIEGEEENMWYFPIMMNKDNVDVNV